MLEVDIVKDLTDVDLGNVAVLGIGEFVEERQQSRRRIILIDTFVFREEKLNVETASTYHPRKRTFSVGRNVGSWLIEQRRLGKGELLIVVWHMIERKEHGEKAKRKGW